MPRHAWIEGGRVRDYTDLPPAEVFHPDVAALYDTVIPDDAERGWSLVDGTWTAPPPPPDPVEQAPQPWATMPGADFLQLLTLEEEAALAASGDGVLTVFYRRLSAPGATAIRAWAQSGVDRMVTLGHMVKDRADAILAGDTP